MWYVIQTRTGYEYELVNNLKTCLKKDTYRDFLVPMFEDVVRNEGKSSISYRRIFPGYVLVDTDAPEELLFPYIKRRLHEFARLLGVDGQDDNRFISSIGKEDAAFLESILENGIMSVSYVECEKNSKIKRIVGPLARYGNRITKLEYRKRRAIVDVFVFGKQRRIKFGLWSDEDPEIPWIKEALKSSNKPEYILEGFDIGIYPGDKVIDLTGTYKDDIFIVEKVNMLTRKIRTKGMMFGEMRNIELSVDQVEKI